MEAWIGQLAVAAHERRQGVEPAVWADPRFEQWPEALRSLYAEMDGASLPGEVQLFPLSEVARPDESRQAWCFGQKGAHKRLFALRHADAAEALGDLAPAWLATVPQEGWVYGVKEGAVGPLRLYRRLPAMLEVLVPPRQTEEFGEHTFARALMLVESALDTLKDRATALKKARTATRKDPAKPRAKKPRAAKRAAAPEKPGRKVPKRPAKKKVASKQTSARRPAKKPAKRTKAPPRRARPKR